MEATKAALPFQFEPEYEEDESQNNSIGSGEEMSEDEENNVERNREDLSLWCTCGRCEKMETVSMCVCCKELGSVSHLAEDINCVTCHQSFENVCLNRDVLWTALVSLHDRESSHLPNHDNIPNKSLRYAAYRQFTWWKHGHLGKRVRRVIPSCVVKTIRSTFPNPNGQYTGFKDIDGETEIDMAWEF